MIAAINLFGGSDLHVEGGAYGVRLQHEVLNAFERLRASAKEAGFDLRAASSFRDFERQKAIWNLKANGEKAVLDSNGRAIDILALPELERVHAIMRWSALPGASRHHWGTDLDIYDASALSDGQEFSLLVEETVSGGVFYPMYTWLESYFAESKNKDFFRPYDIDRGGVAIEPWHLSYAPLSHDYQARFSCGELAGFLSTENFELKICVLNHLDELFERYIINCGNGG